jgi:hypothetical protein
MLPFYRRSNPTQKVRNASAKRVFHLVGMDDHGNVVRRKRLTREALMPFIA